MSICEDILDCFIRFRKVNGREEEVQRRFLRRQIHKWERESTKKIMSEILNERDNRALIERKNRMINYDSPWAKCKNCGGLAVRFTDVDIWVHKDTGKRLCGKRTISDDVCEPIIRIDPAIDPKFDVQAYHNGYKAGYADAFKMFEEQVRIARLSVPMQIVMEMPLMHGVNCKKVQHREGIGYLHSSTHDDPYFVDGITYCGRCHIYLPGHR